MPKRKMVRCPKTQQRAMEWVSNFATCTQLRHFLGFAGARSLTRPALLHLVLLNPPSFEAICATFRESALVKKTQKKKRAEANAIRTQSKQAWKYLARFIKPSQQTFAKIKPCVCYEWKRESSGPGQYLVRMYGEEKSKVCRIQMINEMPTSIKRLKQIDICTLDTQTLDY